MVVMVKKIGINSKGIRSRVDCYIHNKNYTVNQMKEVEENTANFIRDQIKEGEEIELYFYDNNIAFRIQYIEFLKQAILSKKNFILNLMLFDSVESKYIKYRVK